MIKARLVSPTLYLITNIFLGLLVLFIASQNVQAQQWTTNGNNINNTNTGNVGIGTTTPGAKLDIGAGVAPRGSFSDLLIGSGGNASQIELYHTSKSAAIQYDGAVLSLYTNGNAWIQALTVDNAGNVGIGTTNPTRPLEVLASNGEAVRLYRNVNNVGWGVNMKFAFNNSSGAEVDYAGLHGVIGTNTTGAEGGHLVFTTTTSGSLTEKMRIDPLGNVGIGITNPANKLHVAGSITVDGNINAKYQDVAEWVPAAKTLPPGTVVTLNRTQSNFVEASTKAYDTRVAGVISEKPGIALGESGENKVLVATTGRVRIKVDASRGAIEIGDLLVTSDKEGVAMKSMPVNVGGVEIHRPGTLIGKALEPLVKGQGEILVLLSLQ